jgi:PKD repeat protein
VSIDDGSGDDGGGDTNSAPTASFTYSCMNLSCNFDGSGSSDSDGSITSYDWEFGDGTTASGQTVSHTYDSDGTYTVTLTVTNDSSATDSESQYASVSPSTTFAVDSITPNSVSAGSSVDVTITRSGFESGTDVALENGSGPTPSVSNTTVVDGTEITATISTKSGGPPRNRVWDVRVTNPDGTSDVLADGCTVTE